MRSDHDILTPDELIELTGHQYKSRQCRWLNEAGIWYKQRRDGSPSTTWYHIAHPYAGRQPDQCSASNEPDFDAM
ncbi:DUF4224 domain-containing protein [Pantoea sp. BAV 3049]|uniref:DUF4224 domain-containing protein n=1 Tax=Pantoea sp. BAV 3049 TaxID=2654188 RepID=UPI00131C8597|nr:DUF4224 domain-containing protein [Pantoea sp. BAV 3049]